jgi:hypothetical protein
MRKDEEMGWTKGMPPRDPLDRVAPRCDAWIDNRRCVRVFDHLERVEPLAHLLIFVPEGKSPIEGRYREVWGAGAGV